MRAFGSWNGWLGTMVAASAWAVACGSSEGRHSPHGTGARAGSATAGSSAAGSAASGAGGMTGGTAGTTAGSGTAASAGTSTGGTSEAGSGGAGSGEAGQAGAAASAGDTSHGGADDGSAAQGGQGDTTGHGGASGEGGAGAEGGRVHADKIDLLFVVDNSISMFEKQTLLSAAIPKLVQRLVDPWCTGGTDPAAPADDDHACPAGRHLELDPVTDMHVGVITTSLGAHGSHDVCSDEQNAQNQTGGDPPSDYNDKGQLLPFVRTADALPSWNGSGFLNWDPDKHSTPVGQDDPVAFIKDVRTVIESTNAHGCGYESTLEAMYRFLVDPEPPKVIDHDMTSVTTVSTDPSNTDTDVLDQRSAFLRPDSALVIISLSDEDDCSINDDAGGQGWLVGFKGGVNTVSWHMPRASAACAADPNDHCCAPCGNLPSDCAADSTCDTPALTSQEDSLNLRCFDQKQRFGIDLLYSLDRYVAGLSAATVPRRSGGTAPNPLFKDGRDPRLVVFTPIVGVPWQDLAQDPTDTDHLDLLSGHDLRTSGHWPALVGNYAAYTPPTDPFMVPAIDPRTSLSPNKNPFTQQLIVAETSTDPQATINGHEQAVTSVRDDLQFACTFPLGTPVDCSVETDECDCTASQQAYNRPVCQPPAGGPSGTTQYYGKAYPGIRHLEVARQLGDNAVVASICARNTTNSARDDYGYVPAMRALQARLTTLLGSP